MASQQQSKMAARANGEAKGGDLCASVRDCQGGVLPTLHRGVPASTKTLLVQAKETQASPVRR